MIDRIITLISLIFWFVIVLLFGFVFHEHCHKFAGWLQGVKCDIKIWWHNGIPSMMCSPRGELDNKYGFLLFGGAFSGAIMIGISAYALIELVIIHPITISLFIVGLINLAYAILHESVNHPMINSDWTIDRYMIMKNKVYIVAGVIGLIIMSPAILRLFEVI